MFSIIVSIKNESIFNSILLPSLDNINKYIKDNNLLKYEIIKVSGENSLCKNYNKGMSKAKFKLKFFIHEDVDLLDNDNISLFFKVNHIFMSFPKTGLVGLIGTTENPKGWWWNCSRDSIVGHLLSNEEYWNWNIDKPNSSVKLLDGLFLATNTDINFSDDIEGFHFYDLDYCHKIIKANYDIKQIVHLVNHKSIIKDISKISSEYYDSKWNNK